MLRFLIHPVIRVSILFVILFCMAAVVNEGSTLKQRISNIVFESYIKFKPRPALDVMRFVDIDDYSLSQVGQWPWSRSVMAEIIKNIAASGAKVIIFDGVLAEPDRTSPENILPLLEEGDPVREALRGRESHDSILANAIQKSDIFVTGFSHGSNTSAPTLKQKILIKPDIRKYFLKQEGNQSTRFFNTSQFLPELQTAAVGNGSFMATAEPDSVIRRTGLLFQDGHQIYPSLVLEGLRIFEKDSGNFIKIVENEAYSNLAIDERIIALAGAHKIPVDAEGKMWVYFRAFDEKENISIYRFLNKVIEKEGLPDLKNKAVFIASSAEGLMDLRATPLGMQPGVRVHMNAFEQIIQNMFLIRPYLANLLELGFAILVCASLIALSFFFSPVLLGALTIFSTVGIFWGAWFLFVHYGGLFDPVTPSVIVIVMFIFTTLLSFLKTELERKQVRQAFGHYISPDFMAELTENPEKLKLGGEIRDLTVLFSDIRSFTTISEGLTPEELIQLMNDFLTPMSDLVMHNRGTIDKYMGDAMMAFWNAPLDVENHYRCACQAALGMQSALEPINENIRKKAEAQNKKPVLLSAGIGINSGPCAVGNMGSKQRFAYSTLGDAVNLASRLEGQTKTYGVNILIGESTWAQVPELATLEMDLIKVKGKTRPVRVFALLGDENVAQQESFQVFKIGHDEMIRQYRTGVFSAAQEALTVCRSQEKAFQMETVYALYQERLEEVLKNPPAGPWDGVYEAKTK